MRRRWRSWLGTGHVHHRRLAPVEHRFSYPVRWLGLDLDEAPSLLSVTAWHGWRRPALLRLHRGDLLPQLPGDDLAAAIRGHCRASGVDGGGRLVLVTTLRSCGLGFNPVSFVLVHDRTDRLTAVLAEITNTPWNERHIYTLSATADQVQEWRFGKAFHVSPFNGMDQTCCWRLRHQDDALSIRMQNREDDREVFRAALELRLRPATPARLWRAALGPPAAALTLLRIYRQAATLFRKRSPFHPHPAHRDPRQLSEARTVLEAAS